jgi:hypothetical protein
MNKEHIKKFVEENPSLVARRATQRTGVWVLKYKNRVFYKNLWTPELLECRGTLIDDDYNIIQRPFTKIFNRGENKTDIPRDEMVYVVEKINGFMGAGTWHEGELLVSTTGSIDSEFADMAKKWLQPYSKMFENYPDYTFIFEIVDKNDPHIIKEKEGVYLLGARLKTWDSKNHELIESTLDAIAMLYGMMRPRWTIKQFSTVVKEVKQVKHEGFVCWTANESIELKIKSPFYLVTKFFGRMNEKRFEEMLGNPNFAKRKIDEEFYSVIDYLAEHKNKFLNLERQERIDFVRGFIENHIGG